MHIQTNEGISKEFIPLLIEKVNHDFETDPINLFSMYVFATQMKYQRFVVGISPSENTIFTEEVGIDSSLQDFITEQLQNKSTIENFAKLKYFLDELFSSITEKGSLNYFYRKEYLISSKKLGTLLNISRATIHRYKDLGMEWVEGVGHDCYPKHNSFYWSNGLWTARIQGISQKSKIRNQTKEELIKELQSEINRYQSRYGGSFEGVFGSVTDPYELEEPDDYFDWRDLLEDLKKLNG